MQPQYEQSIREVLETLRQRLGNEFKVFRNGRAVTIEHNRARHYLLRVDEEDLQITVPLTAEFPDKMELRGDALHEAAMSALKEQLLAYKGRGYRVVEVDQLRFYESGLYDEDRMPVVVAYLCRNLGAPLELYEEVSWLVDQLPMARPLIPSANMR